MFNYLLFAAQNFDPTTIITTVLMIGLVVVVFFFMFRSQKKQEKEANEMRNNLQIGDEITTIGGIIGEIVRIKDETVTIETGKDRTKIRILRTAIRTVDVHATDKYGTAPAKPQEDKSPIKVEKVKVSKKNKKEAAEVVEAAAPEATTEENK
jgi:preprotein translocase subunit YajC